MSGTSKASRRRWHRTAGSGWEAGVRLLSVRGGMVPGENPWTRAAGFFFLFFWPGGYFMKHRPARPVGTVRPVAPSLAP